MSDRTAIFVTGIGRTGASATARLLSLCGAALPTRLMAPKQANAFGYWEPQAAVDLNDEFLAAFGSSWSDPRVDLQLSLVAPRDMQRRFIERIVKVISGGFEKGRMIVIKDPRITGLLGFWLEGARRADFDPVVVQTIRSPSAVASSLRARNNLPREYAAALWLKYNLLGERDSRSVPRSIVAYEDLMSDWRGTVTRMVKEIGVTLDITPEAERQANDFISPQLWHHRDEARLDCMPCGWIDTVYDWLLRATRGERPDPDELDAVMSQYVLAERLFSASFGSYRPPPAYPF